ncbi:hypothetical protein ACODT5_07445 [Streptomyces sp. 5.8]
MKHTHPGLDRGPVYLDCNATTPISDRSYRPVHPPESRRLSRGFSRHPVG